MARIQIFCQIVAAAD